MTGYDSFGGIFCIIYNFLNYIILYNIFYNMDIIINSVNRLYLIII